MFDKFVLLESTEIPPNARSQSVTEAASESLIVISIESPVAGVPGVTPAGSGVPTDVTAVELRTTSSKC